MFGKDQARTRVAFVCLFTQQRKSEVHNLVHSAAAVQQIEVPEVPMEKVIRSLRLLSNPCLTL